MARSTRYVPITVNGVDRKLRFTIEHVETMEIELGYGLVELFSRQQDIRVLVLLLFYGTREYHPELTRDEIRRSLQVILDNDGELVSLYATTVNALKASGVLGPEAKKDGKAALERPPAAADVAETSPATEAPAPSETGSTASSPAPSASSA